MNDTFNHQRRALLTLAPLMLLGARARAADESLISEQDPLTKAVKYVEDAHRAKGAQPGATCANCTLYGTPGALAGKCTLFPGKFVKAAGWCKAWSPL